MTVATFTFGIFETKAKRMKGKIAALEAAVEGKRAESVEAEERFRETLNTATKDLKRLPIAGALVWRGRRDV